MTLLTYIPNRHAYRIEEDHIALHTDQIAQMDASLLACFLDCSEENARDIQETIADGCYLLPDTIHIVDDSVYYLYKEGTF